MPPKTPPQPPDTTPHLDSLIVSNERHAKTAEMQRDTLIRQNEKNNPAPILEAHLQKLGDIHEALKSESAAKNERVQTVADEATIYVKGLKGEKGDRGEKGDKGDTGEVGLQGPQGVQGEHGERGDKGDAGERGDAGPQGGPGVQGSQGIAGPKGDKGDRGNDGSPDSAEDLVKKLIALKGEMRLPYSALRDVPNIESFRKFTAGAETQIWLNGRLFSNQVRILDFIGSGATLTDLGGGAVAITVNASGGQTIYTETPSGTIDGSNAVFTTVHAITTIFSFAMNGQFLHPSDYSVVGTTITFSVPPDVSLAGTPFTIIYA